MGSIPKVVGALSCGFLLCLGLSHTTQAADNPLTVEKKKAGPNASRKRSLPDLVKKDGETLKGVHTITGEVLRIEGENFIVQRSDGKEVRLHIDETTQLSGFIGQGARIEATVNDKHHALSIRQSRAADELNADQSYHRQDGQEAGKKQMNNTDGGQPNGSTTITGEVLFVEGNNCFIKGQDGKVVRLHIDETTLKAKNIEPGDRIEAKVNDQNHVLSFFSDQGIQVHQRTADNPLTVEKKKAGPNANRQRSLPDLVKKDGETLKGVHTITGEVLFSELENYFVQQDDGTQVRLHIDETTELSGLIGQGARIEATVNDKHHALSIRQSRAADELNADQSDRRQDGQQAGEKQMNEKDGGLPNGSTTITGDLVRVEYGDYFVKGQDGKELHMTTDKTTQMMGQIQKGDRIEAKVNDKNHALSIRQTQ